jgi:hypothetical protein
MIEVFQKGNTNETCLLDRGADIDRRKDATKFVNETILHTKRQVWEYTVRPGYCFDTGIIKYELLIVFWVSSLICLVFWKCHLSILECERIQNSRILPSTGANDRDLDDFGRSLDHLTRPEIRYVPVAAPSVPSAPHLEEESKIEITV